MNFLLGNITVYDLPHHTQKKIQNKLQSYSKVIAIKHRGSNILIEKIILIFA
jgi:hypothetical protein